LILTKYCFFIKAPDYINWYIDAINLYAEESI
jgi:hypothetical protein